jgi:hypothetical protein
MADEANVLVVEAEKENEETETAPEPEDEEDKMEAMRWVYVKEWVYKQEEDKMTIEVELTQATKLKQKPRQNRQDWLTSI